MCKKIATDAYVWSALWLLKQVKRKARNRSKPLVYIKIMNLTILAPCCTSMEKMAAQVSVVHCVEVQQSQLRHTNKRALAHQDSQNDFSRFNIVKQLARGVDVLHSQVPPIVHRDIKPQNILVVRSDSTDDVIVKLADFGISSSNVDLSSTSADSKPILITGAPIGTWPYMPPECCAAMDGKGLKDRKFCFDASLDIFALGLVYLYIFRYDNSIYRKILDSTLCILLQISI